MKMSKKPEPEKDSKGQNIITKKFLRKLCEYDELFETPHLNKHLYLHFMSLLDIRELEEYTNLRVLWLENNMISEVKNLENLTRLKCLYLHHNCISKIQNLESLKELTTLNLSFNQISVIENLSQLVCLEDLNISHNSISSSLDIVGVSEVISLKIFDLRSNLIQDSEFLLDSLKALPNLKTLYLKGNECIKDIKFYRKSFIGNLKGLVYFDDKAVTEIERIAADAWIEFGEEGEKEARRKYRDEIVKLNEKNSDEFGSYEAKVVQRYEENKRRVDEARDFQRHSVAFERRRLMLSQFHKIESMIKELNTKNGIFIAYPFENETIDFRRLCELKYDKLEDLLIENQFDFEAVSLILKPTYNCSSDTLREFWTQLNFD